MCVNRWKLASAIDIAVNAARDIRQLRDASVHVALERERSPLQNTVLQVHRVIKRGAPVLLLIDTLGIGFRERGVMVKLRRHHT